MASLLVVLGMLGALGTTLSVAATASSAMLFGLGVDGVVLLYVAYTHAVRSGTEPAAAIDGLAGPSSSMLLGMWTTAATFYGLRFVDFPSLEQLGALIGHSMLVCGVLTLILVPALLPVRHPVRRASHGRALVMPRFASWVDRRRRAIVAVAVAVTIAMGVAATWLRINPTLERLRAVTPGAQLLQEIAPMFGLPDDVYVVLTSGTELERLLAANERLRDALKAALPGTPRASPVNTAALAGHAGAIASRGFNPRSETRPAGLERSRPNSRLPNVTKVSAPDRSSRSGGACRILSAPTCG